MHNASTQTHTHTISEEMAMCGDQNKHTCTREMNTAARRTTQTPAHCTRSVLVVEHLVHRSVAQVRALPDTPPNNRQRGDSVTGGGRRSTRDGWCTVRAVCAYIDCTHAVTANVCVCARGAVCAVHCAMLTFTLA